MKALTYAKAAFERECGPAVGFIRALRTDRGVEMSFTIAKTGKTHIIATSPTGTGRAAIEQAAAQAGRWARTMAERSAA